ncbi:hypothetical protein Cst_c10180 [Thermoclostridium stercorarium subsp. stercorarium DSM 8532]|uniref:Uncharacterized protein n=1 Tax=Thermoclostridium stercorarium (strain ATCC 35414 / DSM 8532 / NCIMB 11754) TaxID=1121335 RepID=L7VNH6_THES1|nr:hypothetical protein Cst_c10180 [Thermoclostridium stercorarium subsp. stercorarium DSM 8532]
MNYSEKTAVIPSGMAAVFLSLLLALFLIAVIIFQNKWMHYVNLQREEGDFGRK